MRTLLALLLLFAATHAHAHKPSDSYLAIHAEGANLSGQWDIALRDLDFAIGLDDSGDGDITWGEVKAHQADIAAYALARLKLRSGDSDSKCTVATRTGRPGTTFSATFSLQPVSAITASASSAPVKSL